MVRRLRKSWGYWVTSVVVLLTLFMYSSLYTYQGNTHVLQPIVVTKDRTLVKSFPESDEKFPGRLDQTHALYLVPLNESYSNTTNTVPPTRSLPSVITNGSGNYTTIVNKGAMKRRKRLYLMNATEYRLAKEIHQARLNHIRKSCRKFQVTTTTSFLETLIGSRGNYYNFAGKRYLPQLAYSANFQVDWPDEVLFCWQYKVGSSAWNAMFAHLLNQTKVLEKKKFYEMREIMYVKENEQMQKALKFYKFLIVRDPFVRLLSAYRDRIQDISHPSWQREHFGPKILAITRPHLKKSQIQTNGSLSIIPSFSEFVKYLLNTPLDNYDPHWKPFWKHCVPCVVNYQAVGRSETQAQDIRFILEESGLARKVDVKILEENAHEGRGDTRQLMLTYYSTLEPNILERLYRKYEVDYLLFDYDVQPLLNDLYPGKNVSFASSFR